MGGGRTIFNYRSRLWTPAEHQGGLHRFNLTVSDGRGGSDVQTVTILVIEENQPPVFDAVTPTTHLASDLSPINLNLTATDPDDPSNALTYSLVDSPDGASIDQQTGRFSWTPTELDGSTHHILALVDDGAGGSDLLAVDIVLASDRVETRSTSDNRPPNMNPITPFFKRVNECDTLSFPVSATDPNGDAMEFSLGEAPSGADLSPPSGFTTTGSATVSWMTTADDANSGSLSYAEHPFRIDVEDSHGLTDSARAWATVYQVLPTFTPVGTLPVYEGYTVSWLIIAENGACSDQMMTYSPYNPLSSAANYGSDTDAAPKHQIPSYSWPDGASITSGGSFSWDTSVDDISPGLYHIVVTATDGDGRSNDMVFHVMVNHDPAPVIAVHGANPLSVEYGSMYTDPSAICFDTPDGIRFVTKSGSVDTNTPGRYTITYTCTDTAGHGAFATRTVIVEHPNYAPDLDISGSNELLTHTLNFFRDPIESTSEFFGVLLGIVESTESDTLIQYTGVVTGEARYDLTATDANTDDVLTLTVFETPHENYAALVDCDTQQYDRENYGDVHVYQPESIIGDSSTPTLEESVCLVALDVTEDSYERHVNDMFSIKVTDDDTRDMKSDTETVNYEIVNVLEMGISVAEAVVIFPNLYVKLGAAGVAIGIGYADWTFAEDVNLWRCANEHGNCRVPTDPPETTSELTQQTESNWDDTKSTNAPSLPSQSSTSIPAWTVLASITETTTITNSDAMVVANLTGTPAQARSDEVNTNAVPATNTTSTLPLVIYDYGVEENHTYLYVVRVDLGDRGIYYIPLVNVTVPDVTDPVLTLLGPTNMTVPLGPAYAEPGYTATDNIDGDLTGNVTVAGTVDTSAAGTYRLYYDVSDSWGNNAIQQNRTVNVVEHYPYVDLAGGPSQTILQDGGPYIDPGATCVDDVDTDRQISSASGTVDTGTVGTYRLTYACTDSDGNTSYNATRTVTVRDAPPTITMHGNANMTVAHGEAFADPGAACIDLTDGTLPVTTLGTVDTGTLGSYALTYRCADSHGHTAAANRTVAVVPDPVPPTLALLGPDPDTVLQGTTYADPGAACADNVDPARTVYAAPANTTLPATLTLTYECSDAAGNAAVPASRTLTVEDAPPEVLPVSGYHFRITVGETFVDPGAFCSDLTDGVFRAASSGAVDAATPGTYTITYTCTDSHGHAAEPVQRKVLVVAAADAHRPSLLLLGPDPDTVLQLDRYDDPGATCADDEDSPRNVRADAPPDTSNATTVTLTYSCTDSDGHAAYPVTRALEVRDAPPVIHLIGPGAMNATIRSSFSDPGATCHDVTDGQSHIGPDTPGTVDTATPGTYAITYTCTDSHGHAAAATRTVTVLPDTIPPVITLRGPDPDTVLQGTTYADPGAACADNVDPARTVYAGPPDTSTATTVTLTYECSDTDSNAADPITRVLEVRDAPPAITMNGPANATVAVGSAFTDPGATCIDLTDGTLPVTFDTTANTAIVGTSIITYSCTDGHGHTSTVTRYVFVSLSGNNPPVADAGADQAVQAGDTVTLNGTGSSDPDTGDAIAYSWSQTSGATVALSNPSSASPTFTAPSGPETLSFRLEVADQSGLTSADAVNVTVAAPVNNPPVADAGADQAVQAGDTVTLNGTGSSDPDTGDAIAYSWSQTSGATVALSNPSSASPTFTAPSGPETLSFRLEVADQSGLTSADAVNVTVAAPVNNPPVADAGADQAVQAGDTVTLNGTGSSDPDTGDAIAYSWSQTSGATVALSNPSSASPTFTAPSGPETLSFRLEVADQSGLTSADAVNVTVAAPVNNPPVADAGADQAVQAGDTVTLNGTGSSDPDTGDAIAYSWSQTSGATVALSNPSSASPTFTAPSTNSTLVFELIVTDTGSLTDTDAVTVTVTAVPTNNPPTVDAGPDQTVSEGDTVTLSGTASDPDDDPLTYLWTHDLSLAITLANSTALSTTFTAPQVSSNTTVTFTLTADDGTDTASDTTVVIITDAGGTTLGAREIGHISLSSTRPGEVDASWDAPSETPDDYRLSWIRAGDPFLPPGNPSGNAFPTGPSHTITNLDEGETYEVKARARYDGSPNGPWSDTFTVTVAVQPNRAPTADAGADQSVQAGATVTLDGTGSSDPDTGDTIAYSWSQTSGTTIALSDPSATSPTFTAPSANSTLVFELEVADSGSLTGTDTVTVTVTAVPANNPPEVDAGDHLTLAEGASATISGSATDQDGDPLTYLWLQEPSDAGVVFGSPTSLTTTITAPQVDGTTQIILLLSASDGTDWGHDAIVLIVTDSG